MGALVLDHSFDCIIHFFCASLPAVVIGRISKCLLVTFLQDVVRALGKSC
jgi:hypothetical protein